MDNVKLLAANRGLPFAVRWPNLDLKVSNNSDAHFSNLLKGTKKHCSQNTNKITLSPEGLIYRVRYWMNDCNSPDGQKPEEKQLSRKMADG